MRIGQLDQKITLQSNAVSKDASGGMVKTWGEVAKPWAAVRHLGGNERRASSAGGQAAQARTEFTIYARPGINEQMRVLYRGKIYNITHVNPYTDRGAWMLLTCDTGVNNG